MSEYQELYDHVFGAGKYKLLPITQRMKIAELITEARIKGIEALSKALQKEESEEEDLCINCFEPLTETEVNDFNGVCYGCQELETK